jgi:hypothetical protein
MCQLLEAYAWDYAPSGFGGASHQAGPGLMQALDSKSLVPRLVRDFGYPERGAKLVASDLAAAGEPVLSAFVQWWETGTLPLVEVEGYTVSRLVEEQGLHPVAAFLALDWLRRDPQEALRVLAKGHDSVRPHPDWQSSARRRA